MGTALVKLISFCVPGTGAVKDTTNGTGAVWYRPSAQPDHLSSIIGGRARPAKPGVTNNCLLKQSIIAFACGDGSLQAAKTICRGLQEHGIIEYTP
jgi:hypothetical protein